MSPPQKQVAFIDVEASGLTEDSFPIEVGWTILDGGSGSMLIRPAADWSQDAWDDLAEAEHRISWAELLRHGSPADDVARQLNRVLHPEMLVLADGYASDSFWLERLFGASSLVPMFRLEHYWPSLTNFSKPLSMEAARRHDDATPRRHRAREDAEYLRALWIRASLQP